MSTLLCVILGSYIGELPEPPPTAGCRNKKKKSSVWLRLKNSSEALLTLYFYIQCSRTTVAVFILDGKLIRFTVAPVNCKESDGRVCFCYIRCHSSNVLWIDCYRSLTKPVYNKWYSLGIEFGLTKSTTSNVIRPLQSNTFTFHNNHWAPRCWCYSWCLQY